MIKTKKAGITHKGKIRKAGELLSLPAQEEERLVREGWAVFVETWPAGQAASQPEEEEPAASVPEDGPKTDAPEEQENKPHTRSRGTRKSGTPRRTNETDL